MFQAKMPGPISAPHLAPQGGNSVASAFHGLRSNALAPRGGHQLRPGPMVHAPGAPMPLSTSGRPLAAYGHAPIMGGMSASANPMPVRGSQLPTSV